MVCCPASYTETDQVLRLSAANWFLGWNSGLGLTVREAGRIPLWYCWLGRPLVRGLVTTTSRPACAGQCFGTVTCRLVEPLTVAGKPGGVPIQTVAPLAKFVPVTVIVLSVSLAMLAGDTLVTVGAVGGEVKLTVAMLNPCAWPPPPRVALPKMALLGSISIWAVSSSTTLGLGELPWLLRYPPTNRRLPSPLMTAVDEEKK